MAKNINAARDPLFDAFKPVRNKIRKFNPHSVVDSAIYLLHTKVDNKSNLQWKNSMPWILLLIIRWTYHYGDNTKMRAITDKEFNEIYNQVNDLESLHSRTLGLEKHKNLECYMRTQAFAQFPYQRPDYEIIAAAARQLLLFHDTEFDNDFFAETSMSVTDYVKAFLACVLYAGHFGKESAGPWGVRLNSELDITLIDTFFKNFALNFEDGRRYIEENTHQDSTVGFQFRELSPLWRKPFFQASKTHYALYSRRLAIHSMDYLIYGLLKKSGGGGFSTAFGKIFESHIGEIIKNHFPNVTTEEALRQRHGRKRKAVDWVIKEENADIYIDAKSIELHSISQAMHEDQEFTKHLEHLSKAFIQIQSTAHCENSAKPFKYGLIIAYKEFYIHSIADIWEFIGSKIEESLSEENIPIGIENNNVFVVSLCEFDLLMALIEERGVSLGDVLAAYAKERSLSLAAFLGNNYTIEKPVPSYLLNRYEAFIEEANPATIQGVI